MFNNLVNELVLYYFRVFNLFLLNLRVILMKLQPHLQFGKHSIPQVFLNCLNKIYLEIS